MNDAFFRNRLFADVGADTLRSVAIREMDFKAGELIVREGAPGDSLLLVGTGRVQISKAGRQGQEEVLSILEPNDFFGEFAILDHGPRSATAIALQPSLIGEIDRSALDADGERPQSSPNQFHQSRGRAAAVNECAFH